MSRPCLYITEDACETNSGPPDVLYVAVEFSEAGLKYLGSVTLVAAYVRDTRLVVCDVRTTLGRIFQDLEHDAYAAMEDMRSDRAPRRIECFVPTNIGAGLGMMHPEPGANVRMRRHCWTRARIDEAAASA